MAEINTVNQFKNLFGNYFLKPKEKSYGTDRTVA